MRTLFTCLILLFHCSLSYGQSKEEQLGLLFEKAHEFGYFNGSVQIDFEGETLLKSGYGFANREWQSKNDSKTKFRIASLTKQFVGMIALQLSESGKIDLKAYVSDYLDDYPKTSSEKITIHHLLTHSSGIPNFTSFPDFYTANQNKNWSHIEFLSLFSEKPLNFEPGTGFEYSNSNYYLLGVIIEQITQKPFDQVLAESILIPLNMVDTGLEHHMDILENRAAGYNKSGLTYYNSPYVNIELPFTAGSMYSTVDDLEKWNRALSENTLLSPELMKVYFTPYQELSFGEYKAHYAYGYGIHNYAFDPEKTETVLIQEHGGDMFGFTSHIVRIPSKKGLIVLLSNVWRTDLEMLKAKIMNILFDKPFTLPKMDIVQALTIEVEKDSSLELNQLFVELKKSDSYSINEQALNNYGYSLLGQNNIEAAIAIFKINTQEFPNSGNTYDSLGEAYFAANDIQNSKQAYSMALKLNPENKNAEEMLKKMAQ